MHKLAHTLLAYTPEIAWPEPDILLLSIQASLALFGGPVSLCHKIRQSIKQSLPDPCIRLAMAPSARAAWVLASVEHSGTRRVIKPRTLTRKLAALPVQALPATAPFLDWLHSTGCYTLGQLEALPRSGLQQRTSPALLLELDQLYDRRALPVSWVQADHRFHIRHALNYPIENSQAIAQAALPLLEQTCAWLQQHQLACQTLLFELHYESGRHACPPTFLRLQRAHPGWLVHEFLPLLEQQLAIACLPQPVVSIGIGLSAAQARSTQSTSLFPNAIEQRQREDQVLDLIRARLGAHAVLCPAPVADYLPEHANRWLDQSATLAPGSAVKTSYGPATNVRLDLPEHSRPTWLYNPALPLPTRHGRPVYLGKPLQLVQGPERIETRWWAPAGHQQRDYFIALSENAVRYWVYRQHGAQNAQWFLHGMFG